MNKYTKGKIQSFVMHEYFSFCTDLRFIEPTFPSLTILLGGPELNLISNYRNHISLAIWYLIFLLFCFDFGVCFIGFACIISF